MTFELPHGLRGAAASQRFTMAIAMGSDRHVLTGFAGPFGTVPAVTPSPELAVLLARRFQSTSAPVTAARPVVAASLAVNSPPQPAATPTKPAPVRASAVVAVSAAKITPQRQPGVARRSDWGLVPVQSQLGY
jgi:hypothetical protein